MKRIIVYIVAVCLSIISISPIYDVYAAGIHPGVCDFVLYTTDFVSAYKNGEWVDTSFENDKDLNDFEELSVTYNNGEYTLNIIDDIEFTSNKDSYIEMSMFSLRNSSVLNIVGEGKLTLIAATDDYDNYSNPTCIDLNNATLNIGLPDVETGPSILIKDISSPNKQIETIGICVYKSNLSINHATVEISTSKCGVKLYDWTNIYSLNINDSAVSIMCKNNNTNDDYYGIFYDYIQDNSYYDYTFKNSTFNFLNDTNKGMYCIGNDQRLILDNCLVIANNGKFTNLFKIGSRYCDDEILCAKIINSTIESICDKECIISFGKGDLFIEDSYIDICSNNESAIKVSNNINIKYSPEKSTNSSDNPFYFSIKTLKDDSKAIAFEDRFMATRETGLTKHAIINIAPTLNFYSESTPLFNDITITNSKSFDLTDASESQFKNFSIEKKSAIISFDSDGGSPIYPSINIQNYNEIDINNYLPTKNGYIFEGWYFLNPDNSISETVPLTQFIEWNNDAYMDTTVRAMWKKIETPSSDRHIVLDTGVN